MKEKVCILTLFNERFFGLFVFQTDFHVNQKFVPMRFLGLTLRWGGSHASVCSALG
jgi:hypothetical protein